MGDPSFVKNLSWDRGNASNVSVSPSVYREFVAQNHFKDGKKQACREGSVEQLHPSQYSPRRQREVLKARC